MKIKLASILCLAVLVASSAGGSSLVYADAEETSSAMETLAAAVNSDASEVSCMLDSAGADICTVAAKVAQPAPVAAEPEITVAEAAPAIHSADAIVVEVNQTVTIAAPGENAENGAEAADTGSISEPAAMRDAGTTVASAAPTGEAVDAIVIEVTQTVTIATPSQETGSSKEPAHTGMIAAPPATEPAPLIDTNDLDDSVCGR
jgi:hypothetical protein